MLPDGKRVYSEIRDLSDYDNCQHPWEKSESVKRLKLHRLKGYLFDAEGILDHEFESVFDLTTGIYESGYSRFADGTLREDKRDARLGVQPRKLIMKLSRWQSIGGRVILGLLMIVAASFAWRYYRPHSWYSLPAFLLIAAAFTLFFRSCYRANAIEMGVFFAIVFALEVLLVPSVAVHSDRRNGVTRRPEIKAQE